MTDFVDVPAADDHLCHLRIPIGSRIVEVSVPKINWMPREHVQAYQEWTEREQDRANQLAAWEKANEGKPDSKKTKPPFDPDTFDLTVTDIQLRWLKPYMSDTDFEELRKHASAGQAAFIMDRLNGKGEVEPGESSASSDS